jgi:hypothetical protein
MLFMTKVSFNNERGISLIQVLMASTAIAGLALVGLRLAKDQKELAAKTYQTYILEYFTQEVTHLLYRPKVCRETFKGLAPNEGSVDVIKEAIKKASGEEIVRLYFSSKESSSGDGSLFNGEFTINSYRLNGGHPEANIAKNITVVDINLEQEGKADVVSRSIPISYQLDENGNIDSCSAKVIAGEGPAEGFWKRQGEGLNLPNLSATVGSINNRNAGLAIEGKLKLMAEDVLKICDKKRQGVMTFSPEGKLIYCQDEVWKPVGNNVYLWDKSKRYIVTQNKYGTSEKEIGPHRYCHFIRQSFNTSSDRCTLTREVSTQPSLYKLRAMTKDNVTNISCEVSCVD